MLFHLRSGLRSPSVHPARIRFDTNTVSFDIVEGEDDPLTFVVHYTSTVAIEGLSTFTSDAAATIDSDTPGQLSVSIDASGFAAGGRSIVIGLRGTNADAATVTVHVTVAGNPDPVVLALDEFLTTITCEVDGAAPSQYAVAVRNTGGGTMAEPTVAQVGGDETWLTVDIEATADPNVYTLTVDVDQTGLSVDTYPKTIRVSGDSQDVDFDLTLEVVTPATAILTVTPTSLTFFADEGDADPSPQVLTLSNAGGATLDLAGPTVDVPGSETWLDVDNGDISGSSNSYTCTVAPALGALTEGTYNADLEFADANDHTGTRTIPVTFIVNPVAGGENQVAVELVRLDSGSTTVRTRAGVPVRPGWLQPNESDKVRLRDDVSGTDIPVWISIAEGRHPDGSVMFVHYEYDHLDTYGSTKTNCSLIFGNARNTATDLTPTWSADHWDGTVWHRFFNDPAWKTGTFPPAIIQPPKEYLTRCRWWGPYDLYHEGESGGAAFLDTWYSRWRDATLFWWNNWTNFTLVGGPGSAPTSIHTQYDKPAHLWGLWAATGDPFYYKNACCAAVEYRNRGFYAATKPGSSILGDNIAMWEHCPYGMAYHYWMTGDPRTRLVLGPEAFFHANPLLVVPSVDDYDSEPRGMAFTLYTLLAAKQINAPCPSGTWDQRITGWLNTWLPTSANHPGWVASGPYAGAFWNRIMYGSCAPVAGNPPATIYTQNFMIALLCIALSKYITYGDGTHSAIALTRITGMCDFLMTQTGDNVNGLPTIQYNNQSLGCGQQGATFNAQVNLNGIYAAALAHAYAHSGNTTYRDKARELLQTTTGTPQDGNRGPGIQFSGRTYSETFHRSWEALRLAYP